MICRPYFSARQYRRANRTCSLTPDSQPIPENETRSDYSVSLFLCGGTIRQDHPKKKSDKIVRVYWTTLKEGRLDCPKYREIQLTRHFFFAVQFNDSW